MNIKISFNGVDHSIKLESVLQNKLSRLLDKKGSYLTSIEWTFSKENSKESREKELFKSKVFVKGKMKKEFFIEKEDSDIFTTVDLVLRVLSLKISKEYQDL